MNLLKEMDFQNDLTPGNRTTLHEIATLVP